MKQSLIDTISLFYEIKFLSTQLLKDVHEYEPTNTGSCILKLRLEIVKYDVEELLQFGVIEKDTAG